MLRKSLSILVCAGLLASFSLMAAAFFTAQATVTGNQFTAGTLDLTASPATSAMTFTNMASDISPLPSYAAPITITNSGNLALRYSMQTTATDPDGKGLSNWIRTLIITEVSPCVRENLGFTPNTPYDGMLADAGFGDPAMGAQSGDRVLAPGASEMLCFAFHLQSNAPNEVQGASTTTTFTFTAEQVANNP